MESVEAATASQAGGAGRIELCAHLDVGGTTPPATLVERCVAAVNIPVFAMVRPRGGDFVYTDDEARAMECDIVAMATAGAHGVVFGALRADGAIDVLLMRRLMELARPLPITCHKAVDHSRDLPEALDVLLGLGVHRVLTSGGAATAADGAAMLARLVRQAGDALVVMAGGGVRAHNVAALVQYTGVREVHARLLPAREDAAGEAAVEAATERDTVAAFMRALGAAV